MPPNTNDCEPKHDMGKIEDQGTYWKPESQLPSKNVINAGPIYKSKMFNNALKEEIQRLLSRCKFSFINSKEMRLIHM